MITKHDNIGATVALIKTVAEVFSSDNSGNVAVVEREMVDLFVLESAECDFKHEGRCTHQGADLECNVGNCQLDQLATAKMGKEGV
jgi:hypothetical protein